MALNPGRGADWRAALIAGVAVVGVVACSSSKITEPASTVDVAPTLGDPLNCANLVPGTIAAENCTIGQTSYCAANPAAVVPACGDAASACLAMTDNSQTTNPGFRIRSLNVLAPSALQQLQSLIVTPDIDLPVCQASGQGGFNWLLRVDTVANTISSGGAPPVPDPLTTGYCFYEDLYNGSTQVGPGLAPLNNLGNGVVGTNPQIGKVLFMPIFQASGADTSMYVLPLSDPTLDAMTISPDKNCMGSLAGLGEPSACQEWVPGGSMSGFITLENADAVPLPQLGGNSLCTLLTGSGAAKCPRDANGQIAIPGATVGQGGDYCSTTRTAGGCGDAFWLSATFTASAVKFDDSGNQEHCVVNNPAYTENDAGPDAPRPKDFDAAALGLPSGPEAGAATAPEGGADATP